MRFLAGACLAVGLGIASPCQARIPLELDQLDLAVRPGDVPPAGTALDMGIAPVPPIASGASSPPNPVDEVDKRARQRVPNQRFDPSIAFGELTGQEAGALLQEFLQHKTIPLFRLNSTF